MGIERINHFVVLMLENRSFDHMLGYLRSPAYPIAGLTGDEWNPDDPHRENPDKIFVTPDANYYGDLNNPSHSLVPGAISQLFGLSDNEILQISTYPLTPPPNNGFVYNYAQQTDAPPPPTIGPNIMKCFSPRALPALAGLAPEFAICDHWFSSVPGPTWPNRWYVHTGTSDGYAGGSARLSDRDTIYSRLSSAGLSWNIYFHDLPQSFSLTQLWKRPFLGRFRPFPHFFEEDVRTGRLPAYSFIEPRYFDFGSARANDQHPPNDVRFGEQLIASVYNALRNSAVWNDTLLVILYDENGGLYDHVQPGDTIVPDGKTGRDNLGDHWVTFDFNRFGVRVPAVIVSPLIPRRKIDSNIYDHTAVLAALEQRFHLQLLGAREKTVDKLADIVSLDTPRTDTPTHIDPPPVEADQTRPEAALSEFQRALIDLADSLPISRPHTLQARSAAARSSVPAAAEYVTSVAEAFLREA